MRTRLTSAVAAIILAATGLLSSGAPVMAQTTQTILVNGTYNGAHSGGPFPIPAGKSEIEVDANITDAPPGANFAFQAYTSSDGGATWQARAGFNCPGGTVIPKGQTQVVDQSCSTQMGIDLDPARTYLAKYTESSDVAVTAKASVTIF